MGYANRTRQRGFTLVELLTVVAIIALLATILYPVFSRARENGRRGGCQSQLHQLALAAIQYTQDNDERFFGEYVNSVYWKDRVYPYIKSEQLFYCPSENVLAGNNLSGADSAKISYCFNGYYLDDPVGSSVQTAEGALLSEISDPVNTVLFSERTNSPATSTRYICLATLSNAPTAPHFNGANAAFVDGHVKWYPDPGVLYNNTLLWDRS